MTAALVALGVAVLLLVLLGGLLVPWRATPHPPVPGPVLDPGTEQRARALAAEVRPVRRVALALSLLVPLVLGLSPLGALLVRGLPGPPAAVLLQTCVLLVGLPWLLALPTGWWGWRIGRRYGLSTNGAAGWWRDRLVGLLLSLVLGTVVLTALHLLVRATSWWWLWLIAALLPLGLAAAVLLPPVVERLFNRFEPLAEDDLRRAVLALAEQAGVRVRRVLVGDASRRTTTLNAYVSGLGPTRRLVLHDTLLRDAPEPEVLCVLGHELAHARHRDVLCGQLLGAVLGAALVALAAVVLHARVLLTVSGAPGLASVQALPLLLAVATIGGAVTGPAGALVSRRFEQRADETGLALTGDVEAFAAVHRRLAARALADPAPSRLLRLFYGSHPTAAQRLATAERFAAARSTSTALGAP